MVEREDVRVDVVAQQPIRCEPAYWSPDMGLWLETRRLVIHFVDTHRLLLLRLPSPSRRGSKTKPM